MAVSSQETIYAAGSKTPERDWISYNPSGTDSDFLTLFPDYYYSVEHILAVVAERRAFSINIEKIGNQRKVILSRNDNGHQQNLNMLLPDIYQFREGDHFYCEQSAGFVGYKYDFLPIQGFVLSLLHEIAHARWDPPDPITQLPESSRATIRHEQLIRTMRAEAKLRRDQTNNVPLISETALLPTRYAKKVLPHQAKAEHRAWAEAFVMAEQLEAQGFNVLGEFESPIRVQAFVNMRVGTYEYSTQRSQLLIGDPIMKGLFLK